MDAFKSSISEIQKFDLEDFDDLKNTIIDALNFIGFDGNSRFGK